MRNIPPFCNFMLRVYPYLVTNLHKHNKTNLGYCKDGSHGEIQKVQTTPSKVNLTTNPKIILYHNLFTIVILKRENN